MHLTSDKGVDPDREVVGATPFLRLPPECWDQAQVLSMFDELGCRQVESLDGLDGAVVLCPARYFMASEVNALIGGLSWCVLLLVSDEESTFDVDELDHANVRTWVMTPRPGRHDPTQSRYIGEGWAPHLPALLASLDVQDEPTWRWTFAGQVNHRRRRAMVEFAMDLPGGDLYRSPGFTKGLTHDAYAKRLTESRSVLCPSGPATPDSFRCYEALEAGAVPIVDAICSAYDAPGYWNLLLGGDAPFPVVLDWQSLATAVEQATGDWPVTANRVGAWWSQRKRRWRDQLADDIGHTPGTRPDDLITVVIPTSPIPSHPDIGVIDETVSSVRYWLPKADIVIAADGVRPEQEHLRSAYEAYLRRLLWAANHRWGRTVVLVNDEHRHQANITRDALPWIRTPLLLFVEHDTPLVVDEPIAWAPVCASILAGEANLVRFHHEALVLDVHRHLMLDQEPREVEGAPLQRTAQWSQRPHVASVAYYRSILERHFPADCSTMIEDVMHGVVDEAWRTHGRAGWALHRLHLYAPPGNIKRSLHLDGRAGESKYEETMRW